VFEIKLIDLENKINSISCHNMLRLGYPIKNAGKKT